MYPFLPWTTDLSPPAFSVEPEAMTTPLVPAIQETTDASEVGAIAALESCAGISNVDRSGRHGSNRSARSRDAPIPSDTCGCARINSDASIVREGFGVRLASTARRSRRMTIITRPGRRLAKCYTQSADCRYGDRIRDCSRNRTDAQDPSGRGIPPDRSAACRRA